MEVIIISLKKRYDLSKFTLEELLTMIEIVFQFFEEFDRYRMRVMRYRVSSRSVASLDSIIEAVIEKTYGERSENVIDIPEDEYKRIKEKLRAVAEEEIRRSQVGNQVVEGK